ncbi:MAG: helix-turn-helix transcriptional regulator [Planctomycetota bacterium]
MNKLKMEKLRAAGWKVGNAGDFLGLSREETAFIEIKVALALSLKRRRIRRHLTQVDLATLLKSSQSRVAKMEAADASVSIVCCCALCWPLGSLRGDLRKFCIRQPE